MGEGGMFAVNPQRPVIWIRCDSALMSGTGLCAKAAPSISPPLPPCQTTNSPVM